MDADTMMDYQEATAASRLPDLHKRRFAALFRPEEVERFHFWETVAVNRAIAFKMFGDEEEAIEWLTE